MASSTSETGAATIRTTPLTGDEIFQFSWDGWIRPGRILDGVALEGLREAFERVRAAESEAGREANLLDEELWPDAPEQPPTEPGRSVSFLFNLWRIDPNFRALSLSPILGTWTAQLIGARQSRLLEDNGLDKAPRTGGELKWHQDHPYWPLAQPNAVTAWVALDDVTEENGAMRVALGSHLTGERLPAVFGTGVSYFRERRPTTVTEIVDPAELGFEVRPVVLKAGEVSLHHSLTWHASGPNDSDRSRRAVVIRHVGDGTVWLGARRHEFNYSDEEVGLSAGDPIDSEYFPLVPRLG